MYGKKNQTTINSSCFFFSSSDVEKRVERSTDCIREASRLCPNESVFDKRWANVESAFSISLRPH